MRELFACTVLWRAGCSGNRQPRRMPALGIYRDAYGPTENIAMPAQVTFPHNMPPIALPYAIDGITEPRVFDQAFPIPGWFVNGVRSCATPEGSCTLDTLWFHGCLGADVGCPRCGSAFPTNITQTLRKVGVQSRPRVSFCCVALCCLGT